jgi:hypothetical protein
MDACFLKPMKANAPGLTQRMRDRVRKHDTLACVATGSVALALSGCSGPPPAPKSQVVAAAPPRDDGGAAKGGTGGGEHAAALEQLKTSDVTAPWKDRQSSLRVPLPDAKTWVRVKFWGVPSLVGFRYGKQHHAVVGAFTTHVEDNTVPGACTKSFEAWAAPWLETFEVELERSPPEAVAWRPSANDTAAPRIVEIESVFAKTATILARDSYAGAYAAYPVWGKTTCLIVGVAAPSRGEDARAKAVRDRFIKEVLPKVEVLSPIEPKERY